MAYVKVKTKAGTLTFNGLKITDKDFVKVELTFGIRRLINEGSLIIEPAKEAKPKKEEHNG